MYFTDRMAENIKEEIVSNKEEILPSSTVVDTVCTVNLHKDDIKIKNTGIQGEHDSFFAFLKLLIVMICSPWIFI